MSSTGLSSAHKYYVSMSTVFSTSFVLLALINACWGDTAPNINYSHNMRILKIPHGTPVGTLIYRLKGSDPDGDALTFGSVDTVGSSLLYFQSASFTEADVYLKAPLTEDRYNLTVFVTDGKTRTQVDSSILVTKLPANLSSETITLSPFTLTNQLFTVFENATRNTTIGYVTARDREASSLPVVFELRGSDKFSITYVFGPRGSSKAEVRLISSLDFERQNLYSLTILAINAWTNDEYDTRNVATLQILVAVRDVQDTPPKFTSLPSVVRLTEEMRVGTLLSSVQAEDGDFGLDQRNVTYSILESRFSSFVAIDSTNGDIFLRRPIQQLMPLIGSSNPFLVSIKASEEPIGPLDTPATMSTTIQMTFVLVSSKNHAPTFATSQLTGTIAENSPNMTPVKWEAESLPLVTDRDAGANGTIYLTFERDTGIFTVVPPRGINELTFSLLVRNNSVLDYEKLDTKKSFQLTLIATDGCTDSPLSAKVPIIIHVTDVNDNAPQFTQSQYEGSIYEDSPIGTIITKVSAIDPDTGIYGKVKFTSLSGVLAKNLAIDEDTGVVTLRSLDNLDREKLGSVQQVTIEVRDENGVGNRNRTKLLIKILDANDNSPQFTQARYDAVLSQDLQSFTQPLVVTAFDADEAGTPNSNVTYEIIEGSLHDSFTIHPITGEINIRKGAFRKDKSLTQANSFSSVHPIKLTESEEESSTGVYTTSDSIEPPSLITLKVRAHDQGIPMKSSIATVLIHRTDSLNRSLTFILPDAAAEVEKKRGSIVTLLTKLTGGIVEIREIHDTHKSSPGAIVHAWVTYPSKPLPVDLRRVSELINGETTRQSKSKQQDKDIPANPQMPTNQINTATILRHEYQTLFHFLIFFVILILLFLLCLMFICCCCCKSTSNATTAKWCQQMATGIKAVADGQNETPVTVSHNPSATTAVIPHKKDSQRRGLLQQQDSTSSYSVTPPSPKAEGGKKNAKKAKEEIIRSKHNTDVTFKPPGFKGRYSHNSYPGYSMRTLKKKVKPDPGGGGGVINDAFIDDAGKQHQQQQTTTEIMYIRSPPIQMTDTEDPMHFDETDVDAPNGEAHQQHATANQSQSRNALNEQMRRRKVSFQMDPVYNSSDTTTTATTTDKVDYKEMRSASNETIVSAEGITGLSDRANSVTAGVLSREPSKTSVIHVTRVTLPGSTQEIESDRSDSDSGIGRRSRQEWNFKNADLMTKKSIFTLAYDGVKTERIKTADSDPGVIM